jgi:hypothetical protein
MIRLANLKGRPRVLRALTGLSPAALAALLRCFTPRWRLAELRRLGGRPGGRVNAVGGGRPCRMRRDADKLLLFLAVCRHGLTYELAGYLFGLDTSNARKLFLRLAPVVEAAADPDLATFLREAQKRRRQSGGRGRVGSWEQLLEACPELREVAVDGTDQPCRRPTRRRPRRQYYSGKQKRHTLRTQVVVSEGGRVLHVSGCYPGRTSELAIYQEERLGALIPPEARQFVDLGFQGLDERHPRHDVRLPHKRPSPGRYARGQRGRALTRGQKQANGLRRRRRVVVEHRLAAIKGYRLLAEVWRSRPRRHNPVFRAIAAVINFRLAAAAA